MHFVITTADYTVPDDSRLHITHVWSASGGSITANPVEQDVTGSPAARTLIAGALTLSGLDVWVAPGGLVDITGTAGFHGWLEPAIP